ncbi:hypothetical protein PHJA_001891300 [Phtheirospermum japonicum]|uniref:Uncharacterized protein n=1 Tax=Phtheirospermum japonicum TaxID=374723 RepID=A0A830CGR8_9LAMI|nr:hypothetical protein PHJA_001891300 [Phtheirospermum japonicum]
MKHLIGFSVYTNNFSGEIPQNLGRFSPLNNIDISENQFQFSKISVKHHRHKSDSIFNF